VPETGSAFSIASNYFRYATWNSAYYTSPQFRTPGVGRTLAYFAGLWTAPSSGLIWYWPVATLLVGLGVIAVARTFVRSPRDPRLWLPAAVALGALFAFIGGLATWWSPFGWIAYGPRLAVPILPAALVVLLYTAGPAVAELVAPLLRTVIGAVAIIALVVLAGWAQFGAPWAHADGVNALIAADDECVGLIDLPIEAPEFLQCTSHVMWRRSPSTLAATFTGGGGIAFVGRVLLSGATALIILQVRQDLSRRTRGRRCDGRETRESSEPSD
jgi:hypothetical protein